MLKLIVDGAQGWGIPVAICGEMAADPRLVPLLIGLGLRDLSVQPRAVAAVREAVREVDVQEAEQRAQRALADPDGRPWEPPVQSTR
jgi:phosphotransferase system enzyme I (PtsI)